MRHGILWSIHATAKTTTIETSFMLAYEPEVVLPIEVTLHTHCLTTFQEELNNTALQEALGLLRSVRGDALLREALYKLRIAWLHECTIKLHPIRVGDRVLRRTKVVACSGEHDKLIAN